MNMKTCTKCHKRLPEGSFYPLRSRERRPGTRHAACKKCHSAACAEYRKRKPPIAKPDRLEPANKEQFWSKVDKRPGHGPKGKCWIWTRARNSKGYGVVRIKGWLALAHRVAYELEVESIPDSRNLLHKCDYPPCVRPSHLRPGTPKDNAQDRNKKGRWVDWHKVRAVSAQV